MLIEKTLKQINKLHQKKYRHELGLFTVEGIKGVEEALAHAPVQMLIVDGAKRDEDAIQTLIMKAEGKNIPVEYAGRKDIAKLKATETFPGIMAVVGMQDADIEDLAGPAIFLDRINDPGNLGTIIRTADWFGIKNIILSEGSVDPYNEKVVRSSMGSLFRANIYQLDDAAQDLSFLKEKKKYELAGFVLDGQEITPMNAERGTKNLILVFGSESHGFSHDIDNLIDTRYTIAGKGEAESLNVAMAAGIAMALLS